MTMHHRLNVACILVTLPSVLILDEPTTGLDSFTAFALLETLQNLARRGRSIILSIHQPRSDAFRLVSRSFSGFSVISACARSTSRVSLSDGS